MSAPHRRQALDPKPEARWAEGRPVNRASRRHSPPTGDREPQTIAPRAPEMPA